MLKSCAIIGENICKFIFGYDEEHFKCIELKKIIYDKISSLVNNGYGTFFLGMDLGVCMWSSEIILDLKKIYPHLKLICVIPHENQANKWTSHQREKYFHILEKSYDNIYISTRYTGDCFLRRDFYMIKRSNSVLFVLNSTNCLKIAVNYALKLNKDVIIIDKV